MRIETRQISELNPAAYNPRIKLQSGSPEFEKLKTSIETFGNVEPIVWNKRTGNVVGGHQRLAVLKVLGVIETEVSVVDMPLKEEKRLNVALNKIKGDWDYEILTDILKEFDIGDLSLSGFSPQEIAILNSDENAASEIFEEDEESYSDFAEEDYSGEMEVDTTNYIVELDFETTEEALRWLEERNLERYYVKGRHSVVIGVRDD